MLVVTRRRQESVVVGDADGSEPLLEVRVLEISGKKVRLGFEIDRGVPVHRSESEDRIRLAAGQTC